MRVGSLARDQPILRSSKLWSTGSSDPAPAESEVHERRHGSGRAVIGGGRTLESVETQERSRLQSFGLTAGDRTNGFRTSSNP
jgi:hypothetical protein